ncbi:MAG: tetratricopeptide repeat protein [Bacteroidales bacterium]
MNKLLLIISLILLGNTAFSAETDSLLHVLRKAGDKGKLAVYEELCVLYYSIDLDSAGYFASKKMELATKLKDVREQAIAGKLLGNVHYFKGAYPMAIDHYNRARVLAEKVDDQEIMAGVMNNMGNVYRNTGEYQKAVDSYLSVLAIDSLQQNLSGIGSSLTNIGNVYLDKSDYATAIDYYKRALDIAESLNDVPRHISALNNLGLAYHWISDFEKTSNCYFSALKMAESEGDYYSLVYILLNMGSLYQEWGQQQKAMEYYARARQISAKISDLSLLVKATENIGILYNEMNLPDSALIRFQVALQQANTLGEPKTTASILANMGVSYELKKSYRQARLYYRQSLDIRKTNEDNDDVASSLNDLGRIAYLENDYRTAIAHVTQSNELAQYTATRISNYKLLSDIYTSLNNPVQAFEYFKLYTGLRDSVFTGEKHKQIQELQTQYETDKKEQQIATLSAEKEIEMLKNRNSGYFITGLVFFVVVLVMVGLLIYRNARVESLRQQIELEQRLLRVQMNPHFIFNAISSIQEYIVLKNPFEASSYLADFAKLMRSILNNSTREYITLAEEVETLEHYLKLQQLRFPEKLKYTVSVDEGIDSEELLIPPMLAQPFIENAVNHGVAKRDEGAGEIRVGFVQTGENLVLTVTDNGVGIQQSEQKNGHVSMATQITNSRIANLKKAGRKGIDFAITNMADMHNGDSGVKVVFQLPLVYSESPKP